MLGEEEEGGRGWIRALRLNLMMSRQSPDLAARSVKRFARRQNQG